MKKENKLSYSNLLLHDALTFYLSKSAEASLQINSKRKMKTGSLVKRPIETSNSVKNS